MRRLAIAFILLFAGCAPGNFFCKGKGTLTTAALMYNATVVGDCGEGFEFSKGPKSLPLPPGLAPEITPPVITFPPAPLPPAPTPKP